MFYEMLREILQGFDQPHKKKQNLQNTFLPIFRKMLQLFDHSFAGAVLTPSISITQMVLYDTQKFMFCYLSDFPYSMNRSYLA